MSAAAALRRLALAAILAAPFLTAQSRMAHAEIPLNERRSGYEDMSADNKAMQDDDTSNPAMLAVLDGEALWNAKAGASGKSCADCHGEAKSTMKGVAARYPAIPQGSDKPVDLEGRINLCRTSQQQAEALKPESQELLGLSAYVTHASRGLPIAPPDDPRLAKIRDAGKALFTRREGQLNLSCANCHDDNAGKKLAGATIPQGHPTAYPVYRSEWQTVGSLKRRLRNCLIGMRAEPYEYGAPEYIALELYLMSRARGMRLETPAVRP